MVAHVSRWISRTACDKPWFSVLLPVLAIFDRGYLIKLTL